MDQVSISGRLDASSLSCSVWCVRMHPLSWIDNLYSQESLASHFHLQRILQNSVKVFHSHQMTNLQLYSLLLARQLSQTKVSLQIWRLLSTWINSLHSLVLNWRLNTLVAQKKRLISSRKCSFSILTSEVHSRLVSNIHCLQMYVIRRKKQLWDSQSISNLKRKNWTKTNSDN